MVITDVSSEKRLQKQRESKGSQSGQTVVYPSCDVAKVEVISYQTPVSKFIKSQSISYDRVMQMTSEISLLVTQLGESGGRRFKTGLEDDSTVLAVPNHM
jgi:hypothetical protein